MLSISIASDFIVSVVGWWFALYTLGDAVVTWWQLAFFFRDVLQTITRFIYTTVVYYTEKASVNWSPVAPCSVYLGYMLPWGVDKVPVCTGEPAMRWKMKGPQTWIHRVLNLGLSGLKSSVLPLDQEHRSPGNEDWPYKHYHILPRSSGVPHSRTHTIYPG